MKENRFHFQKIVFFFCTTFSQAHLAYYSQPTMQHGPITITWLIKGHHHLKEQLKAVIMIYTFSHFAEKAPTFYYKGFFFSQNGPFFSV